MCNLEETALCGMFPEIRKAWASVGNSFFLWRFDNWNGHCSEYNGDGEAICAVDLAKTKPDIFVEAFQYLLILATPAKLMLVGVHCVGSSDGTDPSAEVSLHPLPNYTIPSDGVTMTCISCTESGRIFLAGCDGHIYELQYSTGSGGQKQFHKVCPTAGLRSDLSRWVVPIIFKLGAVDPIVEMVIDNERHILYARTKGMKILVFYLGIYGDGPLKKIAEQKNLINQRDVQPTVSGGPRSAEMTIVSISVLSVLESRLLHLVAVLSDGRRIYLSTSSCGDKPNCLEVVTTRPAPPLGDGLASRLQGEDLPLKIESAYCSAGTLVLSESDSSLLIVNKDSSSHRPLRELVSPIPIKGKMLFVADVPPQPGTAATVQLLYSQLESGKDWARSDLSTQHILPRRRVFIFSTMGMMEAAFNRPIDVLNSLFESNSHWSLLEDFFSHFGSGESAAMCLMLAARIVYTETSVSDVTARKAAKAYKDPRLVGVPQQEGTAASPNTRSPAGFSMSRIVQRGCVFSAAHEGLCLISSRILLPLWELPVFIMRGNTTSDVIACRLPGEAMQILEKKIRSLEMFLRSSRNQRRGLYGCVAAQSELTDSVLIGAGYRSMLRNRFASHARNVKSNEGATNRRQQLPYSSAELAAMEVRAIECIRHLLLRCGEALFLLQLLLQHNITCITQNLHANIKQDLVQLTFQGLVCSEKGDKLVTRLVSALMEHCTGPGGKETVDFMSGRLRKGCPSYYKESDYKFYLAIECLERASATLGTEERKPC